MLNMNLLQGSIIITRDFIVLVFNIEVFQIKFFLKIKSLKKKIIY